MSPSAEQLPVVSFVIPVRNAAARLRHCIASVQAAGYPPDRLEIVVADNGSTDGSDRVGREAGAHVLSLPGMPVAELRNRAAAAARGEILAFVDADHEIDAAWIRSAVETLDQPGIVAVGAACQAPSDGTWVQAHYDGLRRRPAGVHEVEWLGSGNMAVRRDAFDRVGGFDTRLETCEDVDLCRRLRTGGARIMSDSRLRNVHFGDPATLRELFTGELWRGRDNLRVSLRPPLSFRNVASALVPLAQLSMLVVCTAEMVIVSSWSLPLALAAAGGIATLVSLHSFRMIQSRRVEGPLGVLRVFAVASVYDMARALALVVRAPHWLRHTRSS